jgi:hypothetical protein
MSYKRTPYECDLRWFTAQAEAELYEKERYLSHIDEWSMYVNFMKTCRPPRVPVGLTQVSSMSEHLGDSMDCRLLNKLPPDSI